MRHAPATLGPRGASSPTHARHAAGWVELAAELGAELTAPERAHVVLAAADTVVLAGDGAWHALGPVRPLVVHGQTVQAGEVVAAALERRPRWAVTTRPAAARAWDEPACVVSLDPHAWLHGVDAPWPTAWALDPQRAATRCHGAWCVEVVA